MKKKLQLKVVLGLKKELEDRITRLEESIRKNNISKTDINTQLKDLEQHQDLLVTIKLAIQKANNSGNLLKKSNNYYIYLHSNVDKQRRLYMKMANELTAKKDKEAQLKKATLIEKARDLRSKLDTIKQKLTKFNEQTTLFLDLDPNLNLTI